MFLISKKAHGELRTAAVLNIREHNVELETFLEETEGNETFSEGNPLLIQCEAYIPHFNLKGQIA